ncbi:MAG: hypothetical protein LBH43_01445 [Treponema sp.]|jgi:hypothetical protein|nr:hypothetical protein [Treponema sp.]
MSYRDNMSEAEYLESQQDFTDERSERQEEIEDTKEFLNAMSDNELLNYIIRHGKKLNTLPSFKTYDIAKRIKDNGWKPTTKQRKSLINTAAIALNT